MSIESILAELDTEIKKLQQARAVLASIDATSQHAATSRKPAAKKRKWRMSAEARERIAAAQRKRWAKQKAAK